MISVRSYQTCEQQTIAINTTTVSHDFIVCAKLYNKAHMDLLHFSLHISSISVLYHAIINLTLNNHVLYITDYQ